MISTQEHFPDPVTTGYFVVRLVKHPFAVLPATPRSPEGKKIPAMRIETPLNDWGAERARGTDQWHLICCMAGSGIIRGAGREIRLTPREVLLFRPRTPQYYELDWELGRWDYLWALFTPRSEWMDLLAWPEEWPGMMKLRIPKSEAGRMALSRLFEAHHFCTQPFPVHERFVLNALENFLLRCHLLTREMDAPATDPRILQALATIREHYAREDLDTATLAAPLGLSASRLEHLFREQTGHTPRHYIEQERFTHARMLLAHSKKTISEIGYAVGIRRPDYFSVRFKELHQRTPSEFREEHEKAKGAGLNSPSAPAAQRKT